jgi:hypothetical protein
VYLIGELTTIPLFDGPTPNVNKRPNAQLLRKTAQLERAIRYLRARHLGTDCVPLVGLFSPGLNQIATRSKWEDQAWYKFWDSLFKLEHGCKPIPAANSTKAPPYVKPEDSLKFGQVAERALFSETAHILSLGAVNFWPMCKLSPPAACVQFPQDEGLFEWSEETRGVLTAYKVPAYDCHQNGARVEIDLLIKMQDAAFSQKISPPNSPPTCLFQVINDVVAVNSTSNVLTVYKSKAGSAQPNTFGSAFPELFALFKARRFIPFPTSVIIGEA